MIFHKAVTSAKVAVNVFCHAGKVVRCPPPSPEESVCKIWLRGGGEVLGKVLVEEGVVLLDCLCVSVNRHVSSQSNTSSV